MVLIERIEFLSFLQAEFEKTLEEGHAVFIIGEPGIGKTSLIQHFCKKKKNDCFIYTGTCDDLFSPRPLAPLYDVALQMDFDFFNKLKEIEDPSSLFMKMFQKLRNESKQAIMVFEDIHWADAATLDFIKFFIRRITQTNCLFICTYRNNEIQSQTSLNNLLGELPPASYSSVSLTPLSKKAVNELAREKGHNGDEVYSITGGNPFYVNEILASYSPGVPEKIKDSILSVYNRHELKTKQVWDLLSIVPNSFEVKYLKKILPSYEAAIEYCLGSNILIQKDGFIFFKHELYRRTIESSLSHRKKVSLHKKILALFIEDFERNDQTERIIHHAKNAENYELVIKYAPFAAKKAASMGAHQEACRLYLSAINFYNGNDIEILLSFYEAYSYECYLTSHLKEAITYQQKALDLWKEKNDPERIGNCLRFLSRLWWFDGNRKLAEHFGQQAVEVLKNQPSSRAKAMAFSNMSQLKMQSDQNAECIMWGEKALAIAKEVNDKDTIAHALNNMGNSLMVFPGSISKGMALLKQSLKIALKNNFQEHVARSYTALGSSSVTIKNYGFAAKTLEAGIKYCEERDIDSVKFYMLAWQSRMYLETGKWTEAYSISTDLLKKENLSPPTKIGVLVTIATIKIRRGDANAIPLLLEAKEMAFQTMELVRIIPTFMALLEYEWITGDKKLDTKVLADTINHMVKLGKFSRQKSRFYFWLMKAGKEYLLPGKILDHQEQGNKSTTLCSPEFWGKIGSPYEQALTLFEGTEDDKRKAISIIKELGADAVYEKMKFEMRHSGIRKIPRGSTKSTSNNPAKLTRREMDVLQLLKEGMQNKEIASKLYISAKTVDHHISSILFKLDVNSRGKAVQEAQRLAI